jgi:transketolase
MLTESQKNNLKTIANTIRGLSIDAIGKANSGHPGMPLGCAEIVAYLYGYGMRYDPKNPEWIDRDRFVLSAGHGSMLQYSALHLSGYSISLDDIKDFRQFKSKTPGHPECEIEGVETTTGPLGQGLAIAVGMALGHKITGEKFEQESLLNANFIVLAGDGCIMEGITSEAASFAGHHKLDNLIVIYDSNKICLDGPIDECLSEDVAKRFEAYGWQVSTIDGYDLDEIASSIQSAKEQKNAPTLIIANTIIGKGSEAYAGTSAIHGKPLNEDEIKDVKNNLGISLDSFNVPENVKTFFKERQNELHIESLKWAKSFDDWKKASPEKAQVWDQCINKEIPNDFISELQNISCSSNAATRSSSSQILQEISKKIPFFIGGSADLSCSDKTAINNSGVISPKNFNAKNIKYGVREFAMAAISNGLALHGMFLPYCGTFLVFSDYMRNAIRLSALMDLPVIYNFTHDSFYVGEDGPTHQPVEHVASLRAIPNLTVIRPADATEVKGAWATMIKQKKPAAIILSRQNVKDLDGTEFNSIEKGAYVVKKEKKAAEIDLVILASGSEVSLAIDVASELENINKNVRVVSFPSFELFEKQSKEYQDSILGNAKKYCSIEAQISFGWHKYIGKDGIAVSIEQFGLSGKDKDLEDYFGFTKEKIIKKINLSAV